MKSNSISTANKENRRLIQNLERKNNREIAAIKNKHEADKTALKSDNKAHLTELKLQNRSDLLSENIKTQEMLNKLQNNTERVREDLLKKEVELTKNFEKIRNDKKLLMTSNIQKAKNDQQLILDDLQHQVGIELQEIRERQMSEKQNLTDEHLTSTASKKAIHKDKIKTTKTMFLKQQRSQEEKFNNALFQQNKQNESIKRNRIKQQKQQLTKIDEMYNQAQFDLNTVNTKRLDEAKKGFEKKYTEFYKQYEEKINELAKRKEQILNGLKGDMKKELSLGLEKDKDPFYQFSKIDYKVTETADKKGYKIEIPMAQHDAKKVMAKIDKRQVEINLDRTFKFNKEEANGKSSVFKTNTYNTEFEVADILNPKTLKKDVIDNKVIFTIQKA